MKIGKLALRAVQWIGKAVGILKTPAGRMFGEAMLGQMLGEKAPRYLEELTKLEKGVGAHTDAWRRIGKAAAKRGGLPATALSPEQAGVVAMLERGGWACLPPQEAKYMGRFKRLWDDYVKKPLQRVAKKLGL